VRVDDPTFTPTIQTLLERSDDLRRRSAGGDRRHLPPRGKDRRNLATRVPGVWTEEERHQFLTERHRDTVEMANGDPRRI
jgi:hypothetical protein